MYLVQELSGSLMAIAPQTSTVTITLSPGQLLGLTLCQVSNSVNDITPGLIHELNQRCPGTIEVGDRVVKVASRAAAG